MSSTDTIPTSGRPNRPGRADLVPNKNPQPTIASVRKRRPRYNIRQDACPKFDASSDSLKYENNDFGSVWLSEFLSYEKTRNESIAKADLLNFTQLPGSTVHPEAEKHLIQQTKCSQNTFPNVSKAAMSDYERLRLEELGRTLDKKNTDYRQKKNGRKITPYLEANTKLSRVLKHAKLKTKIEDMQISQLNKFYILVTKETHAAIKIQSQCRRVLASKFTLRHSLEVKSATVIQSSVRRFLATRALDRLKVVMRQASLVRETCIRLYVARCLRQKRIELEMSAVIVCQSVVRMYFAKCLLLRNKLQRSWDVNQRTWRSLFVRVAWKYLKLSNRARQIQCVWRRKLARKRFASLMSLFSTSALKIQCLYRRFSAKMKLDVLIYRNELSRRCNKIRLIASTKEYWKHRVECFAQPGNTKRLHDLEIEMVKLNKERIELGEQIHILESHHSDQIELRKLITPSAIASGWEEQNKINIEDTRDRITETKLKLMFSVQRTLKIDEKELKLIESARDEACQSFRHWSDWHQTEQDMLWDFQRQHNNEVEKAEIRRRIIDEQFHWAVKHFMPSGKPDKRKPLLSHPCDSSDRVQQLIDVIKEKSVEFQAEQHLAHTFKSFQKSLDTFGVGVGTMSNDIYDTLKKAYTVESLEESPQQSEYYMSLVPTDQNFNDLGNASLYPQQKAFPLKLPWHLLDKVRQERGEIS